MAKFVKYEEVWRDVLFGSGANEVVLAKLAKATGYKAERLSNWKKNPCFIPLEGAFFIARARGLTDAEILKMFN